MADTLPSNVRKWPVLQLKNWEDVLTSARTPCRSTIRTLFPIWCTVTRCCFPLPIRMLCGKAFPVILLRRKDNKTLSPNCTIWKPNTGFGEWRNVCFISFWWLSGNTSCFAWRTGFSVNWKYVFCVWKIRRYDLFPFKDMNCWMPKNKLIC